MARTSKREDNEPKALSLKHALRLGVIIAEAESRQAQAGLHDAHSFVGYKLAARMARSLQEAATPSAGVQLAELLTELLQELHSRSLEGDSGNLVAAARSVTAELSEQAAEAALRELVAG